MSKFNNHLKKLAALCHRHKFVIERTVDSTQGPRSVYEYGPLGAELRRNLRTLWWQDVVTSRETVNGLELSIFGLSDSFLAPNSESNLDEGANSSQNEACKMLKMVDVEQLAAELLSRLSRNDLTVKDNLRNHLKDLISRSSIPLRTRSGIYHEVLDTLGKSSLTGSHLAMPAGYAWQTKCVTMETHESNFLRSIEEELLCLQFLCEARTSKYWLNYWRRQRIIWWRKLANVPSNFSSFDIQQKNNIHCATENQYNFPWGKEEIEIINSSTDFNGYGGILGQSGSKVGSSPHSLQITTNLDKGFIALLADAYEEKDRADHSGEVSGRTVLHFHPSLAPYKVALFTHSKGTNELSEVSHQLASELRQAGISTSSEWTNSASEQFYSYHDEIGTPYCVTVLDSTLNNGVVALRNRDTTLQEFLHISDVLKTLQSHLSFL